MEQNWIYALLAITISHAALAQQPGDPDSTFASDGIVTTDFAPTGNDFGEAVAIQPDGKIVVAGTSFNGSTYVFALARYSTNGDLDPTFGSGGRVTTAIGNMDDRATAVAIQPDGKIVAAGSSFTNGTGYGFALVRYNPDGSLDNTFSGDGIQHDDISAGSDEAYSIALQPDGKIVLAGYANNGSSNDDFALLRYNPDGTLDNTFSGDN